MAINIITRSRQQRGCSLRLQCPKKWKYREKKSPFFVSKSKLMLLSMPGMGRSTTSILQACRFCFGDAQTRLKSHHLFSFVYVESVFLMLFFFTFKPRSRCSSAKHYCSFLSEEI